MISGAIAKREVSSKEVVQNTLELLENQGNSLNCVARLFTDNALNDATSSYQAIDSDQTNMFGGSSNKKGQAKIELEHKGKITVPKEDIETYIREGHFALENDQRVANAGKETSSYKYQLPESIRQHAELINTKLTEMRICDPAIGSGAFPVGLLHELVNAMLVLKPHFNDKYLKFLIQLNYYKKSKNYRI